MDDVCVEGVGGGVGGGTEAESVCRLALPGVRPVADCRAWPPLLVRGRWGKWFWGACEWGCGRGGADPRRPRALAGPHFRCLQKTCKPSVREARARSGDQGRAFGGGGGGGADGGPGDDKGWGGGGAALGRWWRGGGGHGMDQAWGALLYACALHWADPRMRGTRYWSWAVLWSEDKEWGGELLASVETRLDGWNRRRVTDGG